VTEIVLDSLSWACIVAGSAFAVVGGLGLLRLPDLYSRMHGGGITDTLGAGLILVGLMFRSGSSLATVKLVMILAFLLVTSPTATHAVARAALPADVNPEVVGEEDPPSST
jgi:multicomponent Na+:H+ antiporter subunit G